MKIFNYSNLNLQDLAKALEVALRMTLAGKSPISLPGRTKYITDTDTPSSATIAYFRFVVYKPKRTNNFINQSPHPESTSVGTATIQK